MGSWKRNMHNKENGAFEKNDRRLQDEQNLKLAEAFEKKIALDKKELIILLSLLGNGKTSNVELAERLGLNDGNAAAYHVKLLAKRRSPHAIHRTNRLEEDRFSRRFCDYR